MIAKIGAGLVLLSALFFLIERLWPAQSSVKRSWRSWLTDVSYWFFTPLVTRAVSKGAVVAAIVTAAFLTGTEITAETGLAPLVAQRWPQRLPVWGQALLLALLIDFTGYWMHRVFHRGRLWPFHAVHHSSETLDWLASVRLHPVNDMFGRFVQVVVMLALGFDPLVLAGVVPVVGLYGLVLHANVSWDYGPFRRVLASPRFHRWHHTAEAEGLDKNFAGLLPLWDILFGTYYMPPQRQPQRFGVKEDVPPGLLGQLWWPFRAKSR